MTRDCKFSKLVRESMFDVRGKERVYLTEWGIK